MSAATRPKAKKTLTLPGRDLCNARSIAVKVSARPSDRGRRETRWSRLSSASGRKSTGHVREADNPQSPVVRFGRDKPLKLDAGVELSPFQIAYQTYGTLNAERSNAVLVCHALTGDQHVAQCASGHRQARLVGLDDRARQADRHRALLRHLPERGRRLHGHDRAGLDQSGDRQAVGPGFSRHHHPRHGARAGDAARPSRHRSAVLGRGRLDGRHAGAAMGGELSGARLFGAADRDRRRATRRRTSRSTRSAARP